LKELEKWLKRNSIDYKGQNPPKNTNQVRKININLIKKINKARKSKTSKTKTPNALSRLTR